MKIAGLALVVVGWLLPIVALSYTQSLKARFVIAVIGIAISLFGILGVLNKEHLKRAIWKI